MFLRDFRVIHVTRFNRKNGKYWFYFVKNCHGNYGHFSVRQCWSIFHPFILISISAALWVTGCWLSQTLLSFSYSLDKSPIYHRVTKGPFPLASGSSRVIFCALPLGTIAPARQRFETNWAETNMWRQQRAGHWLGSSLTKHESESLSKLTSSYTSPTVVNQPNEHVFGLVENTHRHRENSTSSAQKGPRTRLNPSWCEGTNYSSYNNEQLKAWHKITITHFQFYKAIKINN